MKLAQSAVDINKLISGFGGSGVQREVAEKDKQKYLQGIYDNIKSAKTLKQMIFEQESAQCQGSLGGVNYGSADAYAHLWNV